MNEKELYQQKKQAQLDEWKAAVDKLKAKASEADADSQLELNKQIEKMENNIEEGKNKLVEITEASEDAWDSIKDGMEASWDSMSSAFSYTADKFTK